MARSAAAAALNLRQSRRLSIAAASSPIPGPCIVHKRGADILHDPWFNKVSCCYKRIEREIFDFCTMFFAFDLLLLYKHYLEQDLTY